MVRDRDSENFSSYQMLVTKTPIQGGYCALFLRLVVGMLVVKVGWGFSFSFSFIPLIHHRR